jgi:hypothetical protein
MANTRISYAPRPDATPEGEKAGLAAIYKVVLLGCHAKQQGDTATAPDDQTGLENAPATTKP